MQLYRLKNCVVLEQNNADTSSFFQAQNAINSYNIGGKFSDILKLNNVDR